MVAQSQQLVNTGKKIDLEELARRTNGKREALAKREENRRNGVKPRELKLETNEPRRPYVDRELRQPRVENTIGQKIRQAVIETVKQLTPDLEEVKRMATAGRDKKGHFVPRETKTKAQGAYELLRLINLAD